VSAVISRLLVANRGEIARRIIRTCDALGIETVAVYSDADATAPHVAEATTAVRLPGTAPADTYLRVDLLLGAARAAGADAVHPGYGFLSESADFAAAVLDAGLTWVGPPPSAMSAMASKTEAKKRMAAAGVPVLAELDPSRVTAADLPLLVKASAGGGGRGMRVVRTLDGLDEVVASARREAESAFGDPAVFCEPFVERGRHIEVQVLADLHGTVWALGERDCSVQRRHQKVLEETPSPAVTPSLRAALCDAAVAAATAVGYVGAGTVEFLLAPDGGFHFLEMNTRLQVEHPVTECVYGLDLVALQLSVAEGVALPPDPPAPRGHAIEARLYAEDPASGWTPQTGTVTTFTVEERATTGDRPYLRVDAGVVAGDVVTPHYDPMLAKVIAWAPTREAALRSLAAGLAGARIHGPMTNRDLLVRVLRHPEFAAGEADTSFLARHDVTAPLADERAVDLSALAAALAASAARRAAARTLRGIPAGWRNVRSQPARATYDGPAGEVTVTYRPSPHEVVSAAPTEVVLVVEGVRTTFTVSAYGDDVWVDSVHGAVALRFADPLAVPPPKTEPGSLLAPMPGTVVRVAVDEGATVERGQLVCVLEAMKMEHPVTAPADGVVRRLPVTAGAQVEAGALLAIVESPVVSPVGSPAGSSEE
jgi:propionyl-CoA carboxylase alpha chain